MTRRKLDVIVVTKSRSILAPGDKSSVRRRVDQSVSQSVSQSISKAVNQSKPVNQLVSHSVSRLVMGRVGVIWNRVNLSLA